jgi:hypothetical protein
MQTGIVFQVVPRGNSSSFVATKWLVLFIPVIAGTIILIVEELNSLLI